MNLKVVFSSSILEPMQLADAALGQVVTIRQVGGERAFRRRLMELGLVPGTRVQLVGIAPLGDPMELLVRGASLSIRRSEARELSVAASVPACCDAAAAEQAPASQRVRLAPEGLP
jgi:ferrous iron transport protein A